MKKILLIAAGLMLMPLPAMSQESSGPEGRGTFDRRGDVESLLEMLGEDIPAGGGRRRGAGFLLRSGDSTIAVRCDARESMRTCVELTMTLLEKARASMGSGGGGGGAGSPGGTSPRP